MDRLVVINPYANQRVAPMMFINLNLLPSNKNDNKINAVAMNPKYSTDSITYFNNQDED